MSIITDTYKDGSYWVFVTCGNNTDTHYEQFGYEMPKVKNKEGRMVSPRGTKILVKIDDLTTQSTAKITKICDICSKQIHNQPYYSAINSRKSTDGQDRCKECGMNYMKTSYFKNPPYEKTLAYNYPYVSSTWNFELNDNLTPEKVFAHANLLCWFTCKVCKNDFDMTIRERVKADNSCPYCAGRRVNDTNSIQATHPEIAAMLWDSEDGQKYTIGTDKKLNFKCPECDHNLGTKLALNVFKQGLSCLRCSDGISYPEKFVGSILLQNNHLVECQKMFSWSKKLYDQSLDKYERKLYDFYIPAYNCIIEVHGKQHYERVFGHFGVKSLKEEKYNDKKKKDLALINGIEKYIVIKADKSDLEYLRRQVINSELSDLINLDIVDWSKCHEYACKTLIKTACDLWGELGNTKTIAEEMGLHRGTITNYLKKGVEIGWCDYDPKEEMRKNGVNIKKNEKRVIRMTLNNEIIDEYKSATEAANIFNLSFQGVSAVCTGKYKSLGGFRWIYKEDYEKHKNVMEPYERKLTNKPIVRLTMNNVYVDEYMSANEAERQLSISRSSIGSVCRSVSRHKSSGGFKWMFKSDYEKQLLSNSL